MSQSRGGQPYRVLLNKCLCYPCWAARCRCGTWLTKHAFTEDDAYAEAEDAITRTDRWGHSCEHTKTRQLVLS